MRKSVVRLGRWRDVSYFGFPIRPQAAVVRDLLSPEERDRSARIKSTAARERFVGARSALRVLLGEILAQRPSEVQIRVSAAGKPFVAGHPLHFSLSHAEKWGAIAMSESHEVGVDIEAPRQFRYPSALDLRLPDVRGLGLLDRWTLAESVLKSLELGVHRIEGLSVANQGDDEVLFAHAAGKAWARRIDFPPCSKFAAAVAVRS